MYHQSRRRSSLGPKQSWNIGATVRVGFMSLQVVEKVATPGDHRPDLYVLAARGRFYRFTPYFGLESASSLAHAREWH